MPVNCIAGLNRYSDILWLHTANIIYTSDRHKGRHSITFGNLLGYWNEKQIVRNMVFSTCSSLCTLYNYNIITCCYDNKNLLLRYCAILLGIALMYYIFFIQLGWQLSWVDTVQGQLKSGLNATSFRYYWCDDIVRLRHTTQNAVTKCW